MQVNCLKQYIPGQLSYALLDSMNKTTLNYARLNSTQLESDHKKHKCLWKSLEDVEFFSKIHLLLLLL